MKTTKPVDEVGVAIVDRDLVGGYVVSYSANHAINLGNDGTNQPEAHNTPFGLSTATYKFCLTCFEDLGATWPAVAALLKSSHEYLWQVAITAQVSMELFRKVAPVPAPSKCEHPFCGVV